MQISNRFFTNERRKGDMARDRGDWTAAARNYEAHLQAKPTDAAIWIQLGHALKEQTLFEKAADVYSTAYRLTPEDPDLRLHLARILTTVEPRDGFRDVLLEAFCNDPDPDILRLLISTSSKEDPLADTISETAVFFSIHDLISYLKGYSTMSGIQRVQAGIALHALSRSDIQLHFIVNTITTRRDTLSQGEFWMLSNDGVRKIIEYASGDVVDQAHLRRLIYVAEEHAIRICLVRGQSVILLGAFWGLGNSVQAFVPSWHAGVVIGAYIYDLIPISHPQYCDPGLVREFSMCFAEVAAVADFFLTISEFTKREVAKFLVDNRLRQVPIETVPLAHSLTASRAEEAEWPKRLAAIEGRPYVAFVSTLEARKNHIYVVKAWQTMIAAGVDVPELIFVGRRGWRVDDLYALLEATSYLNGKVHIVHNVSDGELEAIYAGCLFTVFTSYLEGWGLPVGESLVHGAPCIAADSSAIPEVGGSFVDYVNPDILEEGVALFSEAIQDPAFCRDRRDRIARKFKQRTWEEVGQDFVGRAARIIRQVQADGRSVRSVARLRESTIYRVADLAQSVDDLSAYLHNPWRLLLSAFYAPEPIGAWMRGNFGQLVLDTEAREGECVDVQFQLILAPWAGDVDIHITVNRKAESRIRVETGPVEGVTFRREDGRDGSFHSSEASGDRVLRVRARAGPGGRCVLYITVDGGYTVFKADPREFSIGLASVAYARTDDPRARADLIEARAGYIRSLGDA